MKIKITLKDPDGVSESLRDAAESSVPQGLTQSERESLTESRQERYGKACEPWIEYGEYVTIEIDTEAGTATVCKVK
jgi:hypothetical protein